MGNYYSIKSIRSESIQSTNLKIEDNKKKKLLSKKYRCENPLVSLINEKDNNEKILKYMKIANDETFLKIISPEILYGEYKIKKLKYYDNFHSIYTVISSKNKKYWMKQYKFYDCRLINLKCQTLAFLKKKNVKNSINYKRFFVEVEEIDHHFFYYLNIITKKNKEISLYNLLNFIEKLNIRINEDKIWSLLLNYFNFLDLCSINKLQVNALDPRKIYYRFFQNTDIISSENAHNFLFDIMEKKLKDNLSILFINKKSIKQISNKKHNYLLSNIGNILEDKNFYVDIKCLTQEDFNSENIYKEVWNFCMSILPMILKTNSKQLFALKIESLESKINNSILSKYLKIILKKILFFYNDLPKSSNYFTKLLIFYMKKLKQIPAVEESQLNFDYAFKKNKNYLYYFNNNNMCLYIQYLLYASLEKGVYKQFYIKNFCKNKSIKILVWDEIKYFYFIYDNNERNKNEKIYRFELNNDKIEESFQSKENEFEIEVEDFIILESNYLINQIYYYNGFLDISGLNSNNQCIKFFTINLKNNTINLIKQIAYDSSKNNDILDYWFFNGDIFLFKKKKVYFIEYHHNEEKNITIIEIPNNILDKINKNSKNDIIFVTRPFVYSLKGDLNVMYFIQIDEVDIHILNQNLNKNTEIKNFKISKNLDIFKHYNKLNNTIIMEDKQFYFISMNDTNQLITYFLEINEPLNEIFFHSTSQSRLILKNEQTKNHHKFPDDFSNIFMCKYKFNSYKIIGISPYSKKYEFFDDKSKLNIFLYNQKIFLNEKNNIYSYVLQNIDFLFELPAEEINFSYLNGPRSIYFSGNPIEHNIDLWIFFEKEEETLSSYLNNNNNMNINYLKLYKSILKCLLIISKDEDIYKSIINELNLEKVLITYDKITSKQIIKFDYLKCFQKNKIKLIFDYYGIARDFKKEIDSLPNFCLPLENIGFQRLKNFILNVRFPYATNENLKFDYDEMKKILSQNSNHNAINKKINELLLTFLNSNEILSLEKLYSFFFDLKRSQNNIFSLETLLHQKSLFNYKFDRKSFIYISKEVSLILTYNINSFEVRKYIFLFNHNLPLKGSDILNYCTNDQNNTIYGFGYHPLNNQLFFFECFINNYLDKLYIKQLENNNFLEITDKNYYEPGPLIFLQNCIFQIGGKIKIFKSLKGSNKCYVYPLKDNKWISIVNMKRLRVDPGICQYNDKIWVIAGDTDLNSENFKISLEIYDIYKNTWDEFIIQNINYDCYILFNKGLKYFCPLHQDNYFVVLNLNQNKVIILSFENGQQIKIFDCEVNKYFEIINLNKSINSYHDKGLWVNDSYSIHNNNITITNMVEEEIFTISLCENKNSSKLEWSNDLKFWSPYLNYKTN